MIWVDRMDYQTYAFELLANSDLRGLDFDCDPSGCPYPSSSGPNMVSGQDVLNSLDIGGISYGAWGEQIIQSRGYLTDAYTHSQPVGILLAILVIYRVA